ncbi:hypothetical protein BofuT4_uP088410.1 [Botrytis cinerea T4]|uniref:Uncharacterized protein n=1 Tax=Botryotinia fuckeliana (strain T4) TaxID=999810 RepID=G2YG80_BOTF4|nr:hypothetical protein BofuT4_uP088410.1 [Botrytis cinerea T4]
MKLMQSMESTIPAYALVTGFLIRGVTTKRADAEELAPRIIPCIIKLMVTPS